MGLMPFSLHSQDTIPVRLGVGIKKAIYPQEEKKHGPFYTWMWGKHYSSIYYKTVTVGTTSLSSLFGGLSTIGQVPELHSLTLENKLGQLYLLKPVGGSSSFVESDFFENVYDRETFKDTYLGDFIDEAYTIVHPYSFLASDYLAKSAGLNTTDPRLMYITGKSVTDTIADGSQIRDKIVSLSLLPDLKNEANLAGVDSLLHRLNEGGIYDLDRPKYIRARLFDMLIGDWNKVSESWNWVPQSKGDNIIYSPIVVDRNHAFTKVDGVFFKELMNMLGLGFITDYDYHLKNVKKFNGQGFALDMALTQQCSEDEWINQSRFLKDALTDAVIEQAFLRLPPEVRDSDTGLLKDKLKARRNDLEGLARRYYRELLKNPVITGTGKDDLFVVEEQKQSLRVRIYGREDKELYLDRTFPHNLTKEIWLYTLGGSDSVYIDKTSKNISLLVIGGTGVNDYQVRGAKNISVYESDSVKGRTQSLNDVNLIIPNNQEQALNYDYRKQKYTKWSFTPIGIYDSDLGLNLGTSVVYTVYGFRRAPYTRRHQFSYDYSSGFTYQGIFPSYDERKRLHISAFVGSSAHFENFFGFGNETSGYKNESKKYNRVNIRKYMFTPALYYTINKGQELYVSTSFQMFKVDNPDDRNRYINVVYEDGNSIFDTKFYTDLSVTYDVDKRWKGFVSQFKFMASTGWIVNVGDLKKNLPYVNSHIGVNLKLTDRITFATLMKGRVLLNNKYEFFQSATTELRGYRDNRFIGKQSFYQYTDLRLDMGRIDNPLTPLNYGLFVGSDYGRVWHPDESSKKWHSSLGGGFWLTLLRKFTGKFSYFGSTDGSRFMFELGMGF